MTAVFSSDVLPDYTFEARIRTNAAKTHRSRESWNSNLDLRCDRYQSWEDWVTLTVWSAETLLKEILRMERRTRTFCDVPHCHWNPDLLLWGGVELAWL